MNTNTPLKEYSYLPPSKRIERKYTYEGRTYFIKTHQLEILRNIQSLPKKHLHYLVGQQSNKYQNLTLNELKKSIKSGIREYCRTQSIYFKNGDENKLIKYYCVFETTEDFFHSQHENKIVEESIEMGIHFHLFFTTPDNYSWISFPSLIHTIYLELTKLEHKKSCISKYDYKRVQKLDENFVLYHTKQMMFRPSKEMKMTNV